MHLVQRWRGDDLLAVATGESQSGVWGDAGGGWERQGSGWKGDGWRSCCEIRGPRGAGGAAVLTVPPPAAQRPVPMGRRWAWCSVLLRPSWGSGAAALCPAGVQPDSPSPSVPMPLGCFLHEETVRLPGRRAPSGPTSPLLITHHRALACRVLLGTVRRHAGAHCPRAGSPRPCTGLLWSTAESCAHTTVCAAAGGRSPCDALLAVRVSSGAAHSRSCAAVPAKPQRPG